MNFFGVLNCDKLDSYRPKHTFPDHLARKLGGGFDTALLNNELKVLCGSENLK
jgi:hypothetical protein